MVLFFANWWTALRSHHSLISITCPPESDGCIEPYTRNERILCLGIGLGCAWLSVNAKQWVKDVRAKKLKPAEHFEKLAHSAAVVEQGIESALAPYVPEHALEAVVCSGAAVALNTAAGSGFVSSILHKDWDSQGGWKSCASNLASAWAVLLIGGTLAHAAYVAKEVHTEKSQMLLTTWIKSWSMALLITEPCTIGCKVLLGMKL
eukprot:TRINITY_DN10727_c0_g1_i1.p1 TRINITY_DN10727_c0_g1~~TRINITY_DN10727_c0_g1_i1.p1  ORF type:complete len:228 (-),score=40.85 TRINITY_DN10727_c0_g1_i1:71-685(-)